MSKSEVLNQFFIEFIKLVVSGMLGGIVVAVINFYFLRAQKRLDSRYELQKMKLDTLREIDFMLNWLDNYIYSMKQKSTQKGQDPYEHPMDLLDMVHQWQTLFLDDTEMSNVLQKIEIFINPSRNSFLWEESTSKSDLIIARNDIRMTVRNKIIKIQNIYS